MIDNAADSEQLDRIAEVAKAMRPFLFDGQWQKVIEVGKRKRKQWITTSYSEHCK